jgi:endonuclease/exonuclease/phosphatase family metal-dependent hydrolase
MHFLKSLTILLLLSLSFNLSAESYIYFQNNSSLSFSVNSQQTGSHTMDSDEWWGMNGGTISPWQLETNVLWSNRNEGIHNGTDFFLATTLTSGNESIHLKMKLNGNFTGSDMWQSLEGPVFNQPWYRDSNFHQQTFVLNGKTVTVKYTAYTTGSYDDILFVIQEQDPFPVPTADLVNPYAINVLSYNIYMLTPPISFTAQDTRAEYIHEHVSGYDVLIINEAFHNSARNTLTGYLNMEYPYYTDVVDESGSTEDGGVIIYSRWPIEYSEDIVYSNCDAEDCFAAKGAMYVRIDKLGNKYHVFGTHTQAWADADNVATRQAQMTQLKNFVDAKNIPTTEAVILGGDFNVEKTANYLNEYGQMFTILNTEEPIYQGHPFTYDYLASEYADSPFQEYLDYVMYEKSHSVPDIQTNKVIILRSIANDMWDLFDLSDHLAVHGRFEFPISLPYELANFEGKIIDNHNYINWTTASETNTRFFEIEHSLDGNNFKTLEQVIAAEYSTTAIHYDIIHRNPPASVNYYRLRAEDIDGTESYSEILVLDNNIIQNTEISIFPNPASAVLHIDWKESQNNVRISIYNSSSQLIQQLNTNVNTIDISNYTNGLYFIRFDVDGNSWTQIFVKG